MLNSQKITIFMMETTFSVDDALSCQLPNIRTNNNLSFACSSVIIGLDILSGAHINNFFSTSKNSQMSKFMLKLVGFHFFLNFH